jgi:ATP-dependent DNA ligase
MTAGCSSPRPPVDPERARPEPNAVPPRTNRFGSPLVLSRVHWVRPELVVEAKYLTWTDENLLRQVVYEGRREDKDPTDVRRPTPNQS